MGLPGLSDFSPFSVAWSGCFSGPWGFSLSFPSCSWSVSDPWSESSSSFLRLVSSSEEGALSFSSGGVLLVPEVPGSPGPVWRTIWRPGRE